MGYTGWQGLEILETQEWATRLESSPEKSHLRPTLHWEKSLLLQESCRFLKDREEKAKSSVKEIKTQRRTKVTPASTHQYWETRLRRLVSLRCSTGSWQATCRSWDSAPNQRTFQWLQHRMGTKIS